MNTDDITQERLQSWRERLREENATPMVLVGVGHGNKLGQVVVCLPEGVDDDLLRGSLLFALRAVELGGLPRNDGERAVMPFGQN